MARNSLLCADVPLRNYSLTTYLLKPIQNLDQTRCDAVSCLIFYYCESLVWLKMPKKILQIPKGAWI